MATIGKIRQRSGALIFIIGAAMILFLLSDILSSNNSLFSDAPETSVGTIGETEVSAKYFEDLFDRYLANAKNQRNTSELTATESMQVNSQTWESIVETQLLEEEYEELGLLTSEEEVSDLAYGSTPHQYFSQIPSFQDESKKFDPARLKQFVETFDNAPLESQNAWLGLLEDVRADRVRTKYFSLVSKGMYMTNVEARDEYFGQNEQSTIKFVRLKTADLSDEDFEVSDAEIQAYATKNDMRYENNERGIQYVTFKVQASGADSAKALREVERLTKEFKESSSDAAFVRLNSDGPSADEDKFYNIVDLSKSGLMTEDKAVEFFQKEKGYVFPPSKDLGNYKIVKVSDIREAEKNCYKGSHILIKAEGETDADTAKAMTEARKIMQRIKDGESFSELAFEFGTDGTKAKGGDLGWWQEGGMVKYFQNAVNKLGKDELAVVKTQFGAHVIMLTEEPVKEERKVSIIEKEIIPSSETENNVYGAAVAFLDKARTAQEFADATLELDLNVGIAENLKINDPTITGFEDGRELVKWAFKQESVDAVSDIISLSESYVIALLTEIKVKGDLDVIGNQADIEAKIKIEKKIDQLYDKMQGAYSEDISTIASAIDAQVESAENVNFNTPLIAGLGNELAVVGAVAGLKDGKTSEVIKGDEGVYVVMREASSEVEVKPETLKEYKVKQMTSKATGARFELVPALKKTVVIEDRRYNFY